MQKFNPYYAVIFTSKLTNNTYGYEDVAANMIRLAQIILTAMRIWQQT